MEEQDISMDRQPLDEAAPDSPAREETVSDAGGEAPQQTGAERFALKHFDEYREVGREEVIALAQKGLDYDRIRAERDRLRAAPTPGAQEGLSAFLSAFPDVDPASIPKEVWMKYAAGEPLATAYTMHQNQRLEAELAAERQNKRNAQRSTGSLVSSGKTTDRDDITRTWYADD